MKNCFITFRMYFDVKMNRSVDKNKDYFSPGGYEMVMNGKSVQFDFEESSTSIDAQDLSILHVECRNPDFEEFEDLKLLQTKDFQNVTEIPEFFVYTGETGETDLAPVKLLNCTFVFPYDNWREVSISNDVCKGAILASNVE